MVSGTEKSDVGQEGGEQWEGKASWPRWHLPAIQTAQEKFPGEDTASAKALWQERVQRSPVAAPAWGVVERCR